MGLAVSLVIGGGWGGEMIDMAGYRMSVSPVPGNMYRWSRGS